MRTTVRPTVLLPDTDDVLRVGRIGGNPGLDFSVEVIGTRLASVRTTSLGTWGRDTDERAGEYEPERAYRQDRHQGHYGCNYNLHNLDVSHPNLLFDNFN